MVVYGAHSSVLCTAPSNHARTHAYSRWIRESFALGFESGFESIGNLSGFGF